MEIYGMIQSNFMIFKKDLIKESKFFFYSY
jgi:hypothetical protein